MDKNIKEQFDFAELYGAITLLGAIIDAQKDLMNGPIPGGKLLHKRLTRLYDEMMQESLLGYKSLMESLSKKLEEKGEGEDGN